MIAALIAAAAFAMGSPGEDYQECLASAAREMEVSGEAAADVARATITACIPAEGYDKPGTVGASLNANDRLEVIRELRQAFENQIITKIVRLRACRKTPTCRSASLP